MSVDSLDWGMDLHPGRRRRHGQVVDRGSGGAGTPVWSRCAEHGGKLAHGGLTAVRSCRLPGRPADQEPEWMRPRKASRQRPKLTTPTVAMAATPLSSSVPSHPTKISDRRASSR